MAKGIPDGQPDRSGGTSSSRRPPLTIAEPRASVCSEISSVSWLGPKIQHPAMALPPNVGVCPPNKIAPSEHAGWGVHVLPSFQKTPRPTSGLPRPLPRQKGLWIRLFLSVSEKSQGPLPYPSGHVPISLKSLWHFHRNLGMHSGPQGPSLLYPKSFGPQAARA